MAWLSLIAFFVTSALEGFAMLSVVSAVPFWGSSLVLMGFCLFFVLCYVGVYLAIVHFKVPGWLQG